MGEPRGQERSGVPMRMALTTFSGALAKCWLGADVFDMDVEMPPCPEDLYTIFPNLMGPKEILSETPATEKEATQPQWTDHPSEAPPEMLVAAIEAAPLLQEQQRRRKVLVSYPTFNKMPRAAACNAPSKHPLDVEGKSFGGLNYGVRER